MLQVVIWDLSSRDRHHICPQTQTDLPVTRQNESSGRSARCTSWCEYKEAAFVRLTDIWL